MAWKITKAEVWYGTIPDAPGALDRVVGALAEAGADLECVVSRREPNQPGTGHIYVTPVKGRAAQAAAADAGLQPLKHGTTLRVEMPNRRGIGHRMLAAVAAAGINMHGVTGMALGRRAVAYIGLDSVEDAVKASRAIKAAEKGKGPRPIRVELVTI